MTGRLLILLMVAIGTLPMAWEARTGRFDIFNLKNAFIFYFLLQLGISGWVTLKTGVPSIIGLSPVFYYDYYLKAFEYSCFGLLAFQIGYYFTPMRAFRLPNLFTSPWVESRVNTLVAVFFALGVASFAVFLRINGGLAHFLANREDWRAGGMVGQGFLIFPFTTMAAMACLLHFIVSFKQKRAIWTSLLLLLCASIPALLSGFRGLIALPLVQALVLWNYARSRVRARVLLPIFFLFGLGFTVYGIQRSIPQGLNLNFDSAAQVVRANPEIAYTIVSRSKGAEVFAAEIYHLGREGGYDLGWRAVLETASILIPKSLWKNKPTPSGVRFTTQLFGGDFQDIAGMDRPDYGGVSPTAIGEFYWHFGLTGALAGMLIMGCLAKLIYTTLQNNITLPGCQFLYAIVFTSFAMSAEAVQGYVNGLFMISLVSIASFVFFTFDCGSIQARHRQP
jgi:hypothetical protein